MTTYTIQKGDNLTTIARKHGTTVAELQKLNPSIKNPNSILVGQKLTLSEDKKPAVTQPQESVEQLQAQIAKQEKQLQQMQQQMAQSKGNDIGGLEMFGYGVAGVAAFKGAEKLYPHAKSFAETTYLRGLYAKDAVKTRAQNLGQSGRQAVKHLTKKVELEYAFGKDAVKQNVNKATSFVVRKGKNIVKASSNNLIKSGKIMKLTKAGKAIGKRLPGVGVAIALVETGVAYGKGGTKAAVKQGVKSGSGLAMGAAGAKIGAAIGTAICPGVGTAIGAAIGGIGGYIAGEGAADKVLSWFS